MRPALVWDVLAIKQCTWTRRQWWSNHRHICDYLQAWCIWTGFHHLCYYLPLPASPLWVHILPLNCVFNHRPRRLGPVTPLDSDVCRRLAWIQFNYDKQPAHLLGPWLEPGTGLDKEIPSQSHHGRFMRHPARLFCLVLSTSASHNRHCCHVFVRDGGAGATAFQFLSGIY